MVLFKFHSRCSFGCRQILWMFPAWLPRSTFLIKHQCHQSPNILAPLVFINQIHSEGWQRERKEKEHSRFPFQEINYQNSFPSLISITTKWTFSVASCFRNSFLDPFVGRNRSLNFASTPDIYRLAKTLQTRSGAAVHYRFISIPPPLFNKFHS